MTEIADKLNLPEGWDKQDKDDPNALLEQLEKEINIASDSLALPPYVSNEEVAAAASGGLALYGILFDDHDIEGFSKSPPFPLLSRPAHVEWLSPALGFEVRFFKSTDSNASTKFYKTAKSSGLSIAASVSGGGWGFHASASTAHSSEESKVSSEKRQQNTTHATITQYISQPTRAFRIPREEMELSYEAKTRAKEIKDHESAKRFLKSFGSHVSEGVHTLGGVFFRNLDVTTEREAKVSDVMMAAGTQLDVDVSAGFSGFGVSVGGSVKTNTFDASGSRDDSSSEKISYMSEMTVQSLGPPTTNQAMFSQLLQSNNATWHVIDRGDHTALVPVWQLMSDQEGLKKQAEHLENAWKKKQLKRKAEKTKKRIQKAKELVEQAREITQEASEKSKEELHNKMKEIADELSLPEGWDKQEKDDPNALLEQLDKLFKITPDSLDLPPYVSNEEVAAAASGGLALYGILFDDHDIKGFSEIPPFPFLKRPAHVEWLIPALGFVVRFFKSTESNASTKFYKTAKSSGISIAASVSSSGWVTNSASTIHGSAESKVSSELRQQKNTTHATITQYISQPTGAFRIPREEMELTDEAKTRAEEIKDDESAERFLKSFGSHVSEGVHTLGGVFFRNLDVTTEREAKVSDVMMAAGTQLDVDVSAGFSGFGVSVGGSVKTNTFDASGSRDDSSSEKISYMSEMTVQSLGPPTTNQAMFSQLLQSNNATWHVIDRGDHTALVPVWQLMSDQEGLKKQAEHLENAWEKKQKVKEVTVRRKRLNKEKKQQHLVSFFTTFAKEHRSQQSAWPF